jgi:hypothetical protein
MAKRVRIPSAFEHLAEGRDDDRATQPRDELFVGGLLDAGDDSRIDRPELDIEQLEQAFTASLEATILATRLHLLDPGVIRDELARLRPLVEKTGGAREHEAFDLVESSGLKVSRVSSATVKSMSTVTVARTRSMPTSGASRSSMRCA